MATSSRACELCHGTAALYCAADEAHICWTCDAKVHSANFLVARHTRSVLCGSCGTSTTWRVSGVDFTPQTGFCSECAQRASQGERNTSNNSGGCVVDTADTASATVRPLSGFEIGCSSSNAEGNGVVVTASSRSSESTSQLSSEDMGSLTVDSNTQESVLLLEISVSAKRKRLDCPSPESVPLEKQTVRRMLEDISRGVVHRQSDSTTYSSPPNSIGVAQATQDPSIEARDCNISESQELGYSNRVLTSHSLSSAKYQRMDDRSQTRPSFAHAGAPSAARLMRMLAKWHWDLHLSSPGIVPLALRIFREMSRELFPVVLSSTGVRVTMAVCLRLASGLDEAQITVPKASEVASCAGVSMRRLAMTEIHLLALLGWRRFPV